MPAANTDKLRKKKSNFSTTLNGSIGASDTTITLASTSGLPTDTAITLTIDRVDANAVSTPTLKERVTGVVSGNNLTNCLRGEDGDGGTGKSHTSGAVVEDIWDADTWNDAVDAFLAEHSQAGAHIGFALLAGAQEFTGAKTFGSGLLLTTRPKITTSVDDSNGNELLKVIATNSAVNELTLANGATGGNPVLSATGGDTDVGIDMKAKGAGRFRKPTVVGIMVVDPATDCATGDGKAYFRVPAELNGMNLTGVAMTVYTAGTTGTQDVQLRNKTDSVDMLSTKMTIDSTETDTSTAATPAVIDATKDDVVTGDVIAIDVDAVQTTKAKGLYIEMRFELP